jgi:hypothetical protein
VLADSVIFASKRVDFTEQVLEYLRKQFEASGAKSQ